MKPLKATRTFTEKVWVSHDDLVCGKWVNVTHTQQVSVLAVSPPWAMVRAAKGAMPFVCRTRELTFDEP